MKFLKRLFRRKAKKEEKAPKEPRISPSEERGREKPKEETKPAEAPKE